MSSISATTPTPCFCCGGTPAACECALLIPPFGSPYADYATAAAAIDPSNNIVADCIAYYSISGSPLSSFSASFDGTTFTGSGSFASAQNLFGSVFVSISAKSGATLTFNHTAGAQVRGNIYRCDGTLVENVSGAGPVTSSPLPADDVYYVGIDAFNPPGPGTPFSSCSVSMTSSDVFWVNPVIALWDDSGTTRQLEACPKMLLPPLTESTGTWYASCADANTVLTDSSIVSNCEGYLAGTATTFSFSGGVFSATFGTPSSVFGVCWFSVNATAAATLSAAASSLPLISMSIYDYTGTLVETVSGSSPQTSSALPYTGRYIVSVIASLPPGPGSPTTNETITITGYDSVNPIQARWDAGLTCAALLSCGDTCP